MRRITCVPYAAVVPVPLPLFPLNTPLVPGLVLPLHIFEPRYRDLIQRLLEVPDEEAREFGIVSVRDGFDVERDGLQALYPVGTATLLREATPLPDGRFDIVTAGSRRFRILDVDFSRPLAMAMVEFLDDETDDGDELLAVQVARGFAHYRAALSGQVVDGSDDTDISDEDDSELPTDPIVLSYLVTAAMVLPVAERQDLLASETTRARLILARTILRRETALISALAAVPAIDLASTTPSAN